MKTTIQCKGINTLTSYLNHWLNTNDFEIKAMPSDYFYADVDGFDDCRHIGFSVCDEDYKGQEDFLKTLYNDGLKITVPYFVGAFFHELGHLNTDFYLTDEDWEIWEDIFYDPNCGNDEYFKTKCETLATDWAVTYMNSHLDIVNDFMNVVNNLTKIIYKINT